MTPNETAALLAYIAARLNRNTQPNPLTVEAWHDDLQHVEYAEAKAAARRLTSVPEVIAIHIGHLLGEIRNGRRPAMDTLEAVIFDCDQFYKLTDDNSTYPQRDDMSLAARVYRRAGGFAALHHPQWYTKRITDAYNEVVEEDLHRALVNPDHALTAAAPLAIDWTEGFGRIDD